MRNPAAFDKAEIETGVRFMPRFDANGTIPVVATDAVTGEVLMLAYMNREALRRTIETRIATYWSRSRSKLWKKGETSGNIQRVEALHVDCDQDAIVLRVRVEGHGATCHTGRKSCFYRALVLADIVAEGEHLDDTGSDRKAIVEKLEFIGDPPLFNPDDVYE